MNRLVSSTKGEQSMGRIRSAEGRIVDPRQGELLGQDTTPRSEYPHDDISKWGELWSTTNTSS